MKWDSIQKYKSAFLFFVFCFFSFGLVLVEKIYKKKMAEKEKGKAKIEGFDLSFLADAPARKK